MSGDQLDVFGGAVPAEQLALTGHLAALAQAERELGGRLTADEAGAIIHERRGRHTRDDRCTFCGEDGREALIRLRAKTGSGADQPTSTAGTTGASTTPPWTCVDCGHENPPGAIFCRGCASTQDDDREPRLAGYNHGDGPS